MRRDSALLRFVGPADGGLPWFLMKQFLPPFWKQATLVGALWASVMVYADHFSKRYNYYGYYGRYHSYMFYDLELVLGLWNLVVSGLFCVISAAPAVRFLKYLRISDVASHLFATRLDSLAYTRCFMGVFWHSSALYLLAQVAIIVFVLLFDVFFTSGLGFRESMEFLALYLFIPGLAFYWMLFWSLIAGRAWPFVPAGLAGVYFTHQMLARGIDEMTLLYDYTAVFALMTLTVLLWGLLTSKLPVGSPLAFGFTGIYVMMAHVTPRLGMDHLVFLIGWILTSVIVGTGLYVYLRTHFVAMASKRLFP